MISMAATRAGLDGVRLQLSRFRDGPWLAFWLLIVAILVLPIVLFLLVAFSPRLSGRATLVHARASAAPSRAHCCAARSTLWWSASARGRSLLRSAARWRGCCCGPVWWGAHCGQARCSACCWPRRI